MPWTSPSGNEYQLILLDTNALSEIIKHPLNEGRVFIEKCSPKDHAPCLTIYNLIELRRKSKLFKEYVEFFSLYPSFLLKPNESRKFLMFNLIFCTGSLTFMRANPCNNTINELVLKSLFLAKL